MKKKNLINIKKILTRFSKRRLKKIKESIFDQVKYNSLVSDLIKKLEIIDPTDHEETDSKKDKNDNKEINNDENDNQKKRDKN